MSRHSSVRKAECSATELRTDVVDAVPELILSATQPTEDSAVETASDTDSAVSAETTTITNTAWEGILVIEGSPSGDGRQFSEDALTWADLPLPLRWNKEDSHGGEVHTVAVNVGRIDKIWRDGKEIYGSGVFNLAEEDGRRAAQLVTDGFLRGVSIDADDITDSDVELVWPESSDDENEDEMMFVMPELIIFHGGRIRAATLCDIPAFPEAMISVSEAVNDSAVVASAVGTHKTATVSDEWDSAAQEKKLTSPLSETVVKDMYAWYDTASKDDDGYPKSACKFPHHMVSESGDPGAANLTACSAGIAVLNGGRGGADIPDADRQGVYNHLAAHLRDGDREPPELMTNEDDEALTASVVTDDTAPPAEWFSDPKLSVPTGITVLSSGRVYGHAALWGECHIGYEGTCVSPPHEDVHAYFMTGEVLCANGESVAVGQITLGTGHAAMHLGAVAASEHYDNTGSSVADISVGNDAFGIWVAGAVRQDVPTAKVRELRASGQLSGDWRRIGGKLRLVGLLAVNVPGFPVPRMSSRVASGKQQTLVAAGKRIVLGQPDHTFSYDSEKLRTVMQALKKHVHGGEA